MATRNQIINAVGNREVMTLTYKGKERTVELYYHGIHKDTDKEEVRAYQISGESDSGENEGWKLFTVADIKKLKSTKTDISYREDYNKDDKDFKKLISRVLKDKKVSKI